MYNAREVTATELEETNRQISEELRKVQSESALPMPEKGILFPELHVEPSKPRSGLTVLADGTDWDPGSGAGVYTYYGAAWHKLG